MATYGELLTIRKNLDQVNFLEGANPKFVYAVAKNKSRLDSIIKVMQKMMEPSKEIEEYRTELDKINQKYAELDPDGTVGYVTINTGGGQPQRAYRKIIGEGNPKSDHTKEVDALKLKFDKHIKKYEAQEKTYKEHLKNDVPEGEWRKHMIDIDIIPAGLHPTGMLGCMEFIKEPEEAKEAEPEKETKKK